MMKSALTFVAAVALTGCVTGTRYPKASPGYSWAVLSPQAPSAVAACIGRIMRSEPTSANPGEFIIRAGGADHPVEYAVRSITQKDVTETQIMVRNEPPGTYATAEVVRCSSDPSFVASAAG